MAKKLHVRIILLYY